MPTKKEIDKLRKDLRIEQEIYLRVFNNPTPKIPNRLNDDSVIELCHKRLKAAQKKYKVAHRYDDITECGGCKEEGIKEDDELPGDDEDFIILREQTDSDSCLFGLYLCDKCKSSDDRTLAMFNDFKTGRE